MIGLAASRGAVLQWDVRALRSFRLASAQLASGQTAAVSPASRSADAQGAGARRLSLFPGGGRSRIAVAAVAAHRYMTDANEADLLTAAQRGDRRAFSRLVSLHQRRVFACAVSMLGDGGDADDAVQETFMRAWRAIDRFDGRSQLSTWLYRVCVNVCLNHIRKRKRHEASDITDPRVSEPAADPTQGTTDPRHALEARQTSQRLHDALESLSESLRTTVILVLVHGMPQKEAASVLGCSEGTIAWRIHEARRRLRDLLGEEVAEEADAKVASGGRGS
jgi:RNA polymerase sigma-70 factor (ECF subfamily)